MVMKSFRGLLSVYNDQSKKIKLSIFSVRSSMGIMKRDWDELISSQSLFVLSF